jgi:hypothetical protein
MSAAHTITNTGTANTITNTANTVTKTTWSWREADTANWQALLQQLLHLSSTSPALPALGLLHLSSTARPWAPHKHATRCTLHATRSRWQTPGMHAAAVRLFSRTPCAVSSFDGQCCSSTLLRRAPTFSRAIATASTAHQTRKRFSHITTPRHKRALADTIKR